MDSRLDNNLKNLHFLYGTAWKEEKTQNLTTLALKSGFTAIDTANQRKHYHEAAVGTAFQGFLAETGRKREDYFIQSKFTYSKAQDHRKPYDEKAPLERQVEQSFESTLDHFKIQTIDSFVLHGPYHHSGISMEDQSVWRKMESFQRKGLVRFLGISNVDISQLEELFEFAEIKPQFVQNRCFAKLHWDKKIREFCKSQHIIYQGFSLLTANQHAIYHPFVISLSRKYEKTIPQIIFRFSLDIGILPITGTNSAKHMQDDLDISNFSLKPGEITQIETGFLR